MEAIGVIKVINETVQITEKFKKREFVIEMTDNPKYPQCINFQLVQDSCSMLDQFNLNDKIMVEFELRGRKWTDPNGVDKYFNTLQAWKIEDINKKDDDKLPF
jgi:hypothetical protein|tara:strand:+ start:444 stop:752 length:309 start_codon:yes stop_codon:yes gene_type:complete